MATALAVGDKQALAQVVGEVRAELNPHPEGQLDREGKAWPNAIGWR